MTARRARLPFISLEYSRAAYRADFLVFSAVTLGLLVGLPFAARPGQGMVLAALVAAGFCSWTLIEYLVHRFLMHGVDPIRRWHAEHHRRPAALIGSPTVVSVPLLFGVVFLPLWAWSDVAHATALTLGIFGGFLLYSATHHAVHHWRPASGWLQERQRWHALHHRSRYPACYGVSSAFWDHVFGSTTPVRPGRPARPLRRARRARLESPAAAPHALSTNSNNSSLGPTASSMR